MSRDETTQERIESYLYHSGLKESGSMAVVIYEEEVEPLEDKIKALEEGMADLKKSTWKPHRMTYTNYRSRPRNIFTAIRMAYRLIWSGWKAEVQDHQIILSRTHHL